MSSFIPSWEKHPIIVHAEVNGQPQEMPLEEAVKKDSPEGRVTFRVSATFLKELLTSSTVYGLDP